MTIGVAVVDTLVVLPVIVDAAVLVVLVDADDDPDVSSLIPPVSVRLDSTVVGVVDDDFVVVSLVVVSLAVTPSDDDVSIAVD